VRVDRAELCVDSGTPCLGEAQGREVRQDVDAYWRDAELDNEFGIEKTSTVTYEGAAPPKKSPRARRKRLALVGVGATNSSRSLVARGRA
jgi:hypothetical protein